MGARELVSTEEIDAAQRRLCPSAHPPRTRRDYRKVARWWELEARRGYPSSGDSLRYASNMRLLAEWSGLFGPGSPAELKAKSGGNWA